MTIPRDFVGHNGRPPAFSWPGARVAVALTVHHVEGAELAVGNGDPVRERGWYRPHPDQRARPGLDARMLVYPGRDDIPDSRVVTPVKGDIAFVGVFRGHRTRTSSTRRARPWRPRPPCTTRPW